MSTTTKSTNGIAISFLSSLLGLIIAAIIYQIKWNFPISPEQTISLWLIMLIFLFSIRLYFRVVFIDGFFDNLEPKYYKYGLYLIMPLSAMASIIWTFFDFSEIAGTCFMIVYSLLFAIFSFYIYRGLKGNREHRINSVVSLVADMISVLFWGYYIWYIINYPCERNIDDGLLMIFAAILIIITIEFMLLYKNPFFDYFKHYFRVLRNKTAKNVA